MKRILTLLLAYAVLITAYAVPVFGSDKYEIIINGEQPLSELDITVENISVGENYMLADAKKLGAALGAECQTTDDGATLTKDGKVVEFTVDSDGANVNGNFVKTEVAAQAVNGNVFVPVEFCGEQYGYQVIHERAGKRVRIISRTGTTAPAVSDDLKPGMATLDTELSRFHRPVPTSFEKSNRLDDLIFYTDFSADEPGTDDSLYGEIPDGEEVFSFDDFVREMDKSNDGVSNWYDTWLKTSVVDAAEYDDYKTVTVNADMEKVNIGTAKSILKAYRLIRRSDLI